MLEPLDPEALLSNVQVPSLPSASGPAALAKLNTFLQTCSSEPANLKEPLKLSDDEAARIRQKWWVHEQDANILISDQGSIPITAQVFACLRDSEQKRLYGIPSRELYLKDEVVNFLGQLLGRVSAREMLAYAVHSWPRGFLAVML